MTGKSQAVLGLLAFAALLAVAVFVYQMHLENAPDNLILMTGEITENENNNEAAESIEGTEAYEIDEDFEAPVPTPNPLERAPDFVVFDEDGNEVRLSDFLGEPVVLNFWTTWCPSCVRETPYFQQLYTEMGTGVRVLKVNLLDGRRETRQAVDDFMAAGE